MQLFILCLLLVLFLDYGASIWLKKYIENYHRPTYYNQGHRSKDHVDYNREELEKMYETMKPMPRHRPPFNPDHHPSYYVHVLYRSSMICSGALISYRMVVTSSNCFKPPSQDKSYIFKAEQMGVVTGGELAMSDPHKVIAFYMPLSEENKEPHPVALLALALKLDRNYYRHINIYNKAPREGDHVTMTFVDPYDFKIKKMETLVLNFKRCKTYYIIKELFHISTRDKDFICVRNKRHTKKAACSTRPGDPLLVGNKLAGINMYGEHCSHDLGTVNMDIYLPMRPVVKFIQLATDALRALTHSGPYNTSNSEAVSPLIQSLIDRDPKAYIGENSNYTEAYERKDSNETSFEM